MEHSCVIEPAWLQYCWKKNDWLQSWLWFLLLCAVCFDGENQSLMCHAALKKWVQKSDLSPALRESWLIRQKKENRESGHDRLFGSGVREIMGSNSNNSGRMGPENVQLNFLLGSVRKKRGGGGAGGGSGNTAQNLTLSPPNRAKTRQFSLRETSARGRFERSKT